MAHPLDGCLAKIARATEQFDCLETKIATSSYDADSISFGQKFDSDTSTIKVTIEGVPELPIEWALAVADPLQNLRAALNYLAWELAKWNLAQRGEVREPDGKTQFPINTKPREFSSYMVTDLHPDHVALIERLQPNGADHLVQFGEFALREADPAGLAASHPLATLTSLTNVDKHQALQPTFFTQTEIELGGVEQAIDCIVHDVNITIQLTLYNGAEWATIDVTPTGPEPKVEMKDRLIPQVAFGGCPIEHLSGEVLGAVLKLVRTFEPVFLEVVTE